MNKVTTESSDAAKNSSLDKALLLLTPKERRDSTARGDLFNLAAQYYGLGNYSKFYTATKLARQKAEQVGDTLQITKALSYLAKYNSDNGKNDSAFYYYSKAEKLAIALNDSVNLGGIYINKAFIQLYESDFSGCELTASKALDVLRNTVDKKKIYDGYNLIGICSNEKKSYERALEYHNKALNTARNYSLMNSLHLSSNSLNNIGVVYQNLNNHDQAIYNFELALKDDHLLRDVPSLYSILLDNLAYSKFKIDSRKDVLNLFFRSLKIRDSLQLKSGIVINKIHLSEYFEKFGDTIAAKRYAKDALLTSRQSKVSGDILESLKRLSDVDHKNAAAYSKEFYKINDSLQQSERNIKDRFARIQFETNELNFENNKLEEQNRTLFYFFGGTLMVGLLLFVIKTQRSKNRELLLKQAQQKANEEIYNLMLAQQNTIEESRIKEKKRIAQELHDGVLGRLFGTRLNLDTLNMSVSEGAIYQRKKYIDELKKIEQDIREISHDLNREKYVLINNFVAIVNNLVEDQRSAFKPNVNIFIDEKIRWEAVNNEMKINIYRIIQECLQNVNKYADANIISIEIICQKNYIVVTVADNGVGFNVDGKKKGIGLSNMISRTQQLNGYFEIKSHKNRGTTVCIHLPFDSNEIR